MILLFGQHKKTLTNKILHTYHGMSLSGSLLALIEKEVVSTILSGSKTAPVNPSGIWFSIFECVCDIINAQHDITSSIQLSYFNENCFAVGFLSDAVCCKVPFICEIVSVTTYQGPKPSLDFDRNHTCGDLVLLPPSPILLPILH